MSESVGDAGYEERLTGMALELEGVTQALNEMTLRCTGLERQLREATESVAREIDARHTVESQFVRVKERKELAEERALALERVVQPVVSLVAQIAPSVVGALEAYEVQYLASVGVRRALSVAERGSTFVVHLVPCPDPECMLCERFAT